MPLLNRLTRATACLLLSTGAGPSWAAETAQHGDVLFQNKTFRGMPFTVAWINLEETSLRLYWKRPDGTPFQHFHGLRDWLASEGQELILATNSGIYAKDRTPLGLHVEEGEELRRLNPHKGGRGNFALKPNGVFYIEGGHARIRTTEDYAALDVKPELAVQSGPLLVIGNELHPKFRRESVSVYLRNGIGVVSENRVVVAISNLPVNLHTFASFFKEELECRDALYLDGSLSGLYAPAIERTAAGREYVGILAVTRPKPAGEGPDG